MIRMNPGAIVIALGVVIAVGPPAHADLIGSAEGPAQKLRTVFQSYWDDEMRADPLTATYNGDHRFNDRLADPSVAAHDRRLEQIRATRAALDAIPPDSLNEQDRLDREVLIYSLDDRLAGERFRGHLIPFTQQEGLPLQFAQSVNFHPIATIGDAENYLRRLRAFPEAVDRTIAVMRAGMAAKVVPPRVSMAKTLPQLRAVAAGEPEASPLYELALRLPESWGEADRGRVRDEVKRAVAESVSPAYRRLADFVESEYLPACRDEVGLRSAIDGEAHYAYLARSFTTLPLTPDAIHAIGLEEIARTRSEMDAIRLRLGVPGELDAFLAQLRSDPQRRGRDEASLLAGYREILSRVDARLPDLFGRLPRTDYGIKAIEAYRARSAPGGYYYPPPDDGSRPGYFYVNVSDPQDRTTYSMPALAFHEAVPGHHLQIALAMEVQGRPAFRKFGYFPAFGEGWGLYAEGLPREVGLATDPYSELGRLQYNAWRSARLVVDTGMHHLGWTRDRAIAYLEANTAMPRIEVESEVDRYIAWPGQALAYKIGEREIRSIRAEVEKKLGPRFDIRAFHDRLLSQGSLPLGLLRRRMIEK
ncbi:DUF885 domain-containing protein [Tundrisphaera sp. TA3]|uniref:DUF885 domain-containing protein n=1 Tax=Tundrisphaera sp. TA3 TaxID=3435775 RepID=UPI003EBDDB4E